MSQNGKGDSPRNCHSETYRSNYDAIFRKKTLDGHKQTNQTRDTDGKNKNTETGLRASVGSSRVAVRGMDVPL
jgi:hypothetical protein